MPRFSPDESAPRLTECPTPALNNDHSPAHSAASEVAQPRNKWYQTRKLSAEEKDKKEKIDDVDYVEEVDGVWGKLGEGAPNYKNVGW